MKWSAFLLALPLTAWAAPSRPFLRLQADGSHLLTVAEETIRTNLPSLKDLNVDDFVSIQEKIKESVSEVEDALVQVISGDFGAQNEDDDAHPHPPPHRGPPPHGHPHGFIDLSNYTILEILNASLHRPHPEHSEADGGASDFDASLWPPHKAPSPAHLPLHRLAWLVNASSEAQKNLAAAENVTLLAPTDWALTPPHRRGHRMHHKRKNNEADLSPEDDQKFEIMMEDIEEEKRHQPAQHPFHMKELKQAFKEDEVVDGDHKAFFSKVIGWVLSYHTLPAVSSAVELADHSTFATSLAPGGEPLRISIEPTWTLFPFPHPGIKFNYYSSKRGPTILAKNGIIHLVSAPLLPPLTPLNKLFLFPSFFSMFTNALQKVDLDSKILPPPPSYLADDEDDDFSLATVEDEETASADLIEELTEELTKELSGQWTLFAPTDFAFKKLGFKLLAFLHSPFSISRKVLKYVLAYHIVPDLAFYSDYINNQTSLAPYFSHVEIERDVPMSWLEDTPHGHFGPEVSSNWDLPKPKWPKFPHPGPKEPAHPPPHHKANVTHYKLPTLLAKFNPNATMHVIVVEFRLFGKGPLRRSVIVLPHRRSHSHPSETEEEDMTMMEVALKDGREKKMCPHKREGPKPVKVWKKDGVARNGAIHVIPSLLRPPYYHHNSSSNATAATESKSRHHKSHNQMEWAMKQLFN